MTVFNYIEHHAMEKPNNPALVNGNKKVTYAILVKYICGCQSFLYDLGIKHGERIILSQDNQLDWIIFFLALVSIGCWVVPVPKGTTQYELESIKSATGAKLLDLKGYNIGLLDKKGSCGKLNKDSLKESGLIHLTSGSTGDSKFCVRTVENLTIEGESFAKTFSIHRDDRILSVPPLYHSYALGAACMATLVSGACLYTFDRFVPREVLRIIENEKISILIFVPIMAKSIINTFSEHEYNLSSLRISLVGAGPINEEVYKQYLDKYGIVLMANYGSTETGGVVSRLAPYPVLSIGRPMSGVEVKILDDYGFPVDAGAEGELWVKCRSMLKEYLNGVESNIDKDGYFPMGDIAIQDSDGNLYIRGRKKLLINIGSKKVNPNEVEGILLSYPGVKECTVFGHVKLNNEEAVKAVIAGENLSEEEIRKYCSTKLSQHKIPTLITFCDKLPRNELGKIRRDIMDKGIF